MLGLTTLLAAAVPAALTAPAQARDQAAAVAPPDTTATQADPVASPTAGAHLGDVRVLAHFDRAAGQVAESMALEPDGSVIVGMIPARQVVRVAPDGAVQVLATMPLPPDGGTSTPVVGSAQVTGVARSDSGGVYFLYPSGQGGLNGIWQLSPSGETRLVVPLPADTFPNALAIDSERARFLVTDSAGGRIWQAPLRGGAASVWSADPALAPDGFFGANGMKIHDGAVWASNSDRGTVVRIPLIRNGGSGGAEIRATGLAGIDDFDFTGRGTEILAAINESSKVVRVGADGAHETLLDSEDGLQGTTGVTVRGHRVHVTNGANLAGDDPTLMLADLHRR